MADGYEYLGENDFSDLDEWLCEYVDGTIDPVVRQALEEYMQVNPALAGHVERLRQTRNLLCCYGCRHQAPKSLQPRLQRRLASEIVQESQSLFATYSLPLVSIAAVSSMVAILLIATSASQPPPARINNAALSQTSGFVEKAQRHFPRATHLRSLSNNRFYSHFATSDNSASHIQHLSPTLLLEDPSDTSSVRLSNTGAFASP